MASLPTPLPLFTTTCSCRGALPHLWPQVLAPLIHRRGAGVGGGWWKPVSIVWHTRCMKFWAKTNGVSCLLNQRQPHWTPCCSANTPSPLTPGPLHTLFPLPGAFCCRSSCLDPSLMCSSGDSSQSLLWEACTDYPRKVAPPCPSLSLVPALVFSTTTSFS